MNAIKNKFLLGEKVFASYENDVTRIFSGEITKIEIIEGKPYYQVRDNYGYRDYGEDEIFSNIEDLKKVIEQKLQAEVEKAYERLLVFRKVNGMVKER